MRPVFCVEWLERVNNEHILAMPIQPRRNSPDLDYAALVIRNRKRQWITKDFHCSFKIQAMEIAHVPSANQRIGRVL